MTLELVDLSRVPGYAGPLHALRHPDLANRFHFWCGASGRRYACTRFPAGRVPAYEEAISLFVRRRGGEAVVLAVTTGEKIATPFGTDEVHIHLVQGGAEAVQEAFEDLSALAIRRASVYLVERRAA
jgi:hypothetical protein